VLLEITTTYTPATDLGYLLHKNPDRVQSFPLSFGQAHVFYPEATAERCTAALLLDVDPIGLVRRPGREGEGFALEQYVNDRPYVASSFLSVAIAQVYGTALAGRSNTHPDLVETSIPLEARLSVVPCRGGESFLRRLFEPLGYEVITEGHPLDETFPDWGQSPYFDVRLRFHGRLSDLLAHLYVLIPVLDDDKHYWVGDEEVEKLLRHGPGWLATHPARETITRRYLKRQRSLVDRAVLRLTAEESADPDENMVAAASEEAAVEEPLRLNDQRLNAVLAVLRGSGARRVVDLGCGEGRLLQLLLGDPSFVEIIGFDVSHRALEFARNRLKLDRLAPAQRDRIKLIQGSVVYRDQRLAGYDAAAVVEVIEHLDPPRLAAFERVVFEHARPTTVMVTTPNAEYNRRFPSLPAGNLRHCDHRFEWSRAEFESWAGHVADRFGYAVRFLPVGPVDEELGAPTQMGIFTR
jgi:3' terminal RNA ribose 2'-O-methyltransferase Hen1